MPGVLVIDDDPGTLETFGGVLRDAGFEILLARTGQDGLSLARQQTVDLVLADLRLSDMTGLDVLKQLRQNAIDVPFVLITGWASTASAIEAGQLGASDYLEKPVFAEQLLAVVRFHVRTSWSPAAGARDVSRNRTSHQAIHAMQVIDARYKEADLTVRCVARDLGISTEHLCRVLKQHTGHTFVTLLRRARVRAAHELLHTSTLSMKEIADRAGFRSASRFDRDFKKICGVPPTEYRRAILRRSRTVPPER